MEEASYYKLPLAHVERANLRKVRALNRCLRLEKWVDDRIGCKWLLHEQGASIDCYGCWHSVSDMTSRLADYWKHRSHPNSSSTFTPWSDVQALTNVRNRENSQESGNSKTSTGYRKSLAVGRDTTSLSHSLTVHVALTSKRHHEQVSPNGLTWALSWSAEEVKASSGAYQSHPILASCNAPCHGDQLANSKYYASHIFSIASFPSYSVRILLPWCERFAVRSATVIHLSHRPQSLPVWPPTFT